MNPSQEKEEAKELARKMLWVLEPVLIELGRVSSNSPKDSNILKSEILDTI